MNYKYPIYMVLLLTFVLIVVLIIRKKKPFPYGQIISHTLLYLIEILSITTLINSLIGDDLTKNQTISLINIIRNYVFAYTFYQLLLLITFRLKDSLDIDGYTTIKNLIDKYQLFAEFKKKIPDEDIENVKAIINDYSVTFSEVQRNYGNDLIKTLELYNQDKINAEELRFILKQESREIDFQLKLLSYGWMNSLLLRWFK